MRNATILGAALLCLGLAAAGCTSRQIYDTLQSSQRSRCLEYDESQREPCLAAAEVPYAQYRGQR